MVPTKFDFFENGVDGSVWAKKSGKLHYFQRFEISFLLCLPVLVRPFRFFPLICWTYWASVDGTFKSRGGLALQDSTKARKAAKGGRQATQVESRVWEAVIALLGLAATSEHKRNSASLKEHQRNFRNYSSSRHQFFTGTKIVKEVKHFFCFMIGIVMRGKGCSFEIFQRASSLNSFCNNMFVSAWKILVSRLLVFEIAKRV